MKSLSADAPHILTSAPSSAGATHSRIEWLDSIRGLAAMAVLFNHSFEFFQGASFFKWVTELPVIGIVRDARSAVTMFFVLSGFVLALPYVRARSDGTFRGIKLSSFYFRRFTRIWIPWFAIFVLSWIAKDAIPRGFATIPALTEWAQNFWQGRFTAAEVVKQMMFVFHDSTRLLLPQDWSLGVELKGSLLMPVFIFLFRKNVWALAAVGVGFLVLFPMGVYYATFVLGVLLAGNVERVGRWFEARTKSERVALFGIGLVLFNVRYWSRAESWIHWDRSLWCVASVGCAVLLGSVLGSGALQRMLSRPFFVFLGRISYSLYLVQFLVLLTVAPQVVLLVNKVGIVQPGVSYAIGVVVAVGVTMVFSVFSYRWIEVPSMEFGKRVSKWLEGRRSERSLV